MKVMFIVNDLGVNEPFGPMILSSVLKQKGHETILGVIQKEDVESKISAWKPDILAYSMMSVDMKDMKKFNDIVQKKNRIFTILGGAHTTLVRTSINDPNIDAICIGEGEGPIIDVVERIEKGENIDNIPNIMTSNDSPMNIRSLIEDVDTIPFMDRELVYSYKEMAHFGIKGIWSSRGCAFPCPYCFNNRINQLMKDKGKVVRRRSVDSVIRETKELVDNHRVEFIRIQDDVFVYKSDDWLEKFAERWSSEIGLPFYCLLRSELITDEMAYYLKKAGCFSICMSIEAGDYNVRNKVLRRRISNEKLEIAFKILKKHNINIYANTMLALPFTDINHDVESVDFAIRVKPDMPNFSIFMPYPGTDLGDYCRDAGIYDSEKDDITYGMRNMSPLTCFSKNEKEAQYNLCQLAIVAVKFPRLRNLIINRLIYYRPNKVFFIIHYLFAINAYGKKIFYFKHTLKEYIELLIRTVKHYRYDFTKGKKEKEYLIRKKSAVQDKKAVVDVNKVEKLEKCMEAMASSNVYGMSRKID